MVPNLAVRMTKHAAKEEYLQIVLCWYLLQVKKVDKPHLLLNNESHNNLISIDLAAQLLLHANEINIKISRINENVGSMVMQEVDMKILKINKTFLTSREYSSFQKKSSIFLHRNLLDFKQLTF